MNGMYTFLYTFPDHKWCKLALYPDNLISFESPKHGQIVWSYYYLNLAVTVLCLKYPTVLG